MGTLRGYSVNAPVLFQGIVRQRHVGSRPPTKQRKERVPLPCTIETLETVRKTSKQLANRHIRNRDNSVHNINRLYTFPFSKPTWAFGLPSGQLGPFVITGATGQEPQPRVGN